MNKENVLELLRHNPIQIKQEKLDWDKMKSLLDFTWKMNLVDTVRYGIDGVVSVVKNMEKKAVPQNIVYSLPPQNVVNVPDRYVEYKEEKSKSNWEKFILVLCGIGIGIGLSYAIQEIYKWIKKVK